MNPGFGSARPGERRAMNNDARLPRPEAAQWQPSPIQEEARELWAAADRSRRRGRTGLPTVDSTGPASGAAIHQRRGNARPAKRTLSIDHRILGISTSGKWRGKRACVGEEESRLGKWCKMDPRALGRDLFPNTHPYTGSLISRRGMGKKPTAGLGTPNCAKGRTLSPQQQQVCAENLQPWGTHERCQQEGRSSCSAGTSKRELRNAVSGFLAASLRRSIVERP